MNKRKKKKRKKKKKSPTLQDSLLNGALGIVAKKEMGKSGAPLLQVVEEKVEDLNSDWVLAVHKEGVRKIIKTVAINHSCLKSLSEIAQNLEAIGRVFNQCCGQGKTNVRNNQTKIKSQTNIRF